MSVVAVSLKKNRATSQSSRGSTRRPTSSMVATNATTLPSVSASAAQTLPAAFCSPTRLPAKGGSSTSTCTMTFFFQAEDGIRDKLVTGVQTCALPIFGVTDPFALATLARYPFILFAGINVVLVYLLGKAWFSERAGFLAAALYSIHWLPLVFGSTLYPRIPGTMYLLLAALAIARQRHFTAGVLASLAFAMRYSEIVFLAPLMMTGGVARIA